MLQSPPEVRLKAAGKAQTNAGSFMAIVVFFSLKGSLQAEQPGNEEAKLMA